MLNQDKLEVVKTQMAELASSDDAELIESSKEVAYYTAMFAAAHDSPDPDEVEQSHALEFFATSLDEALARYMDRVNELL